MKNFTVFKSSLHLRIHQNPVSHQKNVNSFTVVEALAPKVWDAVYEKAKWIQYLRPNKTRDSSCLGEGFCVQSWDRSLLYSLWTSRVWTMITKGSPTLDCWNASSWTGSTTVQTLEVRSSLAISPDSCPITYLDPAALQKVSVTPFLLIYFCGLWGIK